MVDYGIILGLLGVASGAASLIYSRSQVVAARRQAEQATRATLLESNRDLGELQQIRSRFFKVPGIDEEPRSKKEDIYFKPAIATVLNSQRVPRGNRRHFLPSVRPSLRARYNSFWRSAEKGRDDNKYPNHEMVKS